MWKQASDELVESINVPDNSTPLWLYNLLHKWRCRPGPWIETARETDAEVLRRVILELQSARSKFPRNQHMLAALVEEVGELSKALLESSPNEEVLSEAIQVATMAIRIATEGDASMQYNPPLLDPNPEPKETKDETYRRLTLGIPPLPEPRPTESGDDEMSEIIELANKLTPKQNREMADYLRGVADLDEERPEPTEPTREQLMRLWEAVAQVRHSRSFESASSMAVRLIGERFDMIEAERGRG